nr:SPOR domain-containing protein [Thiospirillum jenense]
MLIENQPATSVSGFGLPIEIPPPPEEVELDLATSPSIAGTGESLLPGTVSRSPPPTQVAPPLVNTANLPRGPLSTPATGPNAVPSNSASWVVQVASVISAPAAEKRQNELRQRGYPAFIEIVDVNGTRYYRVRVGPEIDRLRADQMAADLRIGSNDQPIVQRYR